YMPFWLATLVDRLVVLAVPLIGLCLPLMRFAPMLYTWRVRRRLMHWYGELKKVETRLQPDSGVEEVNHAFADIDRIESTVNKLSIPLGFSNQVYDLREHIDIVRRRLAGIRARARPADANAVRDRRMG